LVLFAAPAITMRLLSEEQQSGTIELLMTLPLNDSEVVLGKWLAAFITFLSALALTLIFPIILLRFGNPDFNVLLTGYLGVMLWGAGLLAIGTLASAMSENQINAFMLSFGISLALYLSFVPANQLPNTVFSTIFNELSFQGHLGNMLRGLITATDVLYYVIITAVSLFAATRILESRRWR
jgi:ABC-2 type transport system permease protein